MGSDWCCTCGETFFLGPLPLGCGFVLGVGGQCFFSSSNLIGRSVGCLEAVHVLFELRFSVGVGLGRILQCSVGGVSPVLENLADFQFLRIRVDFLFQFADFLQRHAIGDLRYRDAGVFDSQPDHGGHVGDDQDDVLGHLGPGHRFHAAQHRAYEDAAETDEHTDAELQTGEAAGDQADAVDLRHHVNEGTGDRGDDADGADDVAAITRAEEVGNGELAELAQVGCQEQRH